jgi:glycosyltransferase involved in cell wall biosynthesis
VAPRIDADIIVLHFPPNWRRLAWVAALRWRNPGARLVWVEHSYTGAWEARKVPAPARFHAMLRMAYRMVDRVVCVSAGQAAWLRSVTGLGDAAVSVIHPYVANPGLGALDLPRGDDPLRIGAYGRFCEQKGFDQLIRSHRAGAMPGTQLRIGGFGPDAAALQALAGGDPAIEFTGQVSDVADFLSQCDVVAVPSRWEAYGMVANEAREAGRPILVAPVDGLPEQVGAAGMIVDFADGDAVRAAVDRLRAMDLSVMGRAGRLSTLDCGAARQMQWAALIAGLAGATAQVV